MEELIGYMARSLVDDPTQVDIPKYQSGLMVT